MDILKEERGQPEAEDPNIRNVSTHDFGEFLAWAQETLQNNPAMHMRALAVAGNLQAFKEALERSQGFDVCNAKGPDGESVLHNAAGSGSHDIVQHLITTCRCDLNKRDNNGQTPLHWSAHEGHLEVVRCIASQPGCDTSPLEEDTTSLFSTKWSPLCCAVSGERAWLQFNV